VERRSEFIENGLRIAFNRIGMTSPNPPVGSVIVKNGEILSIGGTSTYGDDHAEIVALKNASSCTQISDLKGSEIYITLEPCNHHGKTPPCTEAIIDAGISRVLIPILDPNPLVRSRGVERLRSAGIEVILMKEHYNSAFDIIRPFDKYIKTGEPFIINKSAVSLDGRLSTLTGDSRWISSEYTRYLSHKLRAKVDAIIVGKNTLVNDNPSLNIRFDSYSSEVQGYFRENELKINGRDNYFINGLINFEISDYNQPLRVAVGLPEYLDDSYNILADDNYLIYATDDEICNYKGKTELNIVEIPGETPVERINFIVRDLGSRGVIMAMLEGGGGLAGSFFHAGKIDQFMYIITPRIFGSGISPVNSAGVEKVSDSLKLHDITSAMIMDEVIYTGYKNPLPVRENFQGEE
jgi:diaminohydroxyphosphoribosylaminopyrimidine deaminase / 5-amino-6-(5-phosphoribosylamino)uracil reductase